MIELGKISEETKGVFSSYFEDIYGTRTIILGADGCEEQLPD